MSQPRDTSGLLSRAARLRRWAVATISTWLAILVGILMLLAGRSDFAEQRRERNFDLMLALLPRLPSPEIVIVDIDQRSLAAKGQWPWGRDKIACADRSGRRRQAALDRPRHAHRRPGRALAGGARPPPGGNHRQGRHRPTGRRAARWRSAARGRLPEGADDAWRRPQSRADRRQGPCNPRAGSRSTAGGRLLACRGHHRSGTCPRGCRLRSWDAAPARRCGWEGAPGAPDGRRRRQVVAVAGCGDRAQLRRRFGAAAVGRYRQARDCRTGGSDRQRRHVAIAAPAP